MAEGRILLTEFTNGKKSAECDLTYTKSQRCYVGKMKNTNGKQHDIRICGNEFKHPEPAVPEKCRNLINKIRYQNQLRIKSTGEINASNVNIRT